MPVMIVWLPGYFHLTRSPSGRFRSLRFASSGAGRVAMVAMGRNLRAWILLAVFAWTGAAGVAGIYSRGANCCPACCCGRADCPMRRHGHGMPGRCPTASMPGNMHQAAGCSCSISPHGPSSFLAGPLDFRYDLPRTSFFADLPAMARDSFEPRVSSLDGYFPLPELPPKALLG